MSPKAEQDDCGAPCDTRGMQYNPLNRPCRAGLLLLALTWLLLAGSVVGAKEQGSREHSSPATPLPTLQPNPPQLPASTQARHGSRFERTVRALQAATDDLRADFAITALKNLAHAYDAEAKLASQSAGRHQP